MSFQNPKSELFAICVLDKENKYIFCVVRMIFYCISKILVKGNGLFLHENSCIINLVCPFMDYKRMQKGLSKK